MIARSLLSALLVAGSLPALAGSAAAQQFNPNELPEDVKRIRTAYLNYDVETALALSNDWLVTHPGDALVLELRARSLRVMGRLEDAIKTAELINPRPVRIKLFIAELLGVDKATVAQAQALVDEVAADDPNAIEPHMTRARIYLSNQRVKEAASELSYVTMTKPKSYEGQLLTGILNEMTGAFDQAARIYLPLVAKPSEWERTDSHHERDAVMGLAGVYVKLQRYDEAIPLYQQLCEKMPRSPLMWGYLGMTQSMVERNADAIASYEKAVELSPGAGEYLARLGDLYRGAGRLDDAIAKFERILAVVPPEGGGQVFADLRLAEIRLDQSQLDKAKQHADAALTVAPNAPDVLLISARVREKVGDAAAAKEMYRKAIAGDPLLFDASYRLGLLLARPEDAAEQAERDKLPAAEQEERKKLRAAEQAEGKQRLERHKKLEPLLQDIGRTRKELDLAPRSVPLLTRMAGLLNLGGEYETARVIADRADKLNARSPATCIQLAYISANLGDKAAALKYFERAQKLLPPNYVPEIDGYIEKLKKGEELPLPMGTLYRPAQEQQKQPPPPPPAPAPSGGK